MLRSDARGQQVDLLLQKINSINIDVILRIQNDLEPYDIISLVFLLYEVPDTALQRLIVYQKVSKDIENDSMNLLFNWASHAQSRPSWKHELLEALCICRLYGIIRKMGFHLPTVKEHFLPNNVSFYIHINPFKKVLYRLCETITSENLLKLKKTLLSYNININNHEYCELVFLELMCQKFIIVPKIVNNSCKVDLKKLTEILEHFPSLCSFSVVLNDLELKLNSNANLTSHVESKKCTPLDKSSVELDDPNETKTKYDMKDLEEFFQHFNELNMDEIPKDFLSDKKEQHKDAYPIFNPKRVGVCCIINQEEFYPSQKNIMQRIHIDLSTRHGSTKDQMALEKTMSSLNFEVIVRKNLNHIEFYNFIKQVLKKSVLKSDSVFILCILSHGVRGHIYASDSIKIKVEDIQTLLDSDDAINLHGKPKVMILQACQVNDEPQHMQGLVADGPASKFFLRKSDFLIYWATAPEYEAFRQESKGSLFIQFLCLVLKNKAHRDHIYDIFTRNTDIVTKVCSKVKKLQVPIFESTLRKKLYLCFPNTNVI